MQLNTHAQPHLFNAGEFFGLTKRVLVGRQVIVQMDGTGNEAMLQAMRSAGIDAVPLFDTSGGAGIVPETWPRPLEGVPYHGYAGGLGPKTLPRELDRIAASVGGSRVWIDMERGVRTSFEVLNLGAVRQVLELCAPLVGRDSAGLC